MIFNTVYGSAESEFPLGDPTKYPQSDIPAGTIKLYSEQYISDIGDAINEVTGESNEYTTQEMSGAIRNIHGGGLISTEFPIHVANIIS